MRHVADALNFIASFVAAQAAAYMTAVITIIVVPSIDEPTVDYIYLAALFLAAALAGVHLMKHLRWHRRLHVIALFPFTLGIVVAFVQIMRLDSSMSFADRLSLIAEARLAWFTACAGLAVGSALIWSRRRRSAVPAA